MTKHRTLFYLLAITIVSMAPHNGMADSLGPISEETPPAVCDTGEFVRDVQCEGSYCDNISISCQGFKNAVLGKAKWMPWVSEEQGLSICPPNHYIAGFACNRKYCDNISLYCVEVRNVNSGPCTWTRSFSEEETGKLSFLETIDVSGQFVAANGIRCNKNYCDDKSFNVCEVNTKSSLNNYENRRQFGSE